MRKDYILFIHGVNTRQIPEKPNYADDIFKNIQTYIKKKYPQINLKFAPLYWGEEGKEAQDALIKDFDRSDEFNKSFWFKDFRKKQLLQFAGDAAIYISRSVGSKVVKKLREDASKFLLDYEPGDRLHLVTHSWGTVILFDVLFADRWDDDKVPGSKDVEFLRKYLFGIEPNKDEGLYLSSIHTMGSPIALFSLMSVSNSGHDFSPKLENLLQHLHDRGLNGERLPWQNFAHPGDPIAWPLKPTISRIMRKIQPNLLPDVQDIVTASNSGIGDFFSKFTSQTPLAMLINGGNAHGSYWKSQEVAQKIAQSILTKATAADLDSTSVVKLGSSK